MPERNRGPAMFSKGIFAKRVLSNRASIPVVHPAFSSILCGIYPTNNDDAVTCTLPFWERMQ